MSRVACALLLIASLSFPRPAGGVEVPLPGTDRSLRLGISQSLITEYHTDVDEVPDNPTEKYGEFKNKTDLMLQHG